jgi:tripartite-type tricarboxylate transporter receptor subunit TctC
LLGRSGIIQNLAGGGGNIGMNQVKHAAPDGYTLLMAHTHMVTAPALHSKLGLQPETDFEPLGVIAESPLVLVSKPGVPAGTLPELLRWMEGQPQVTLANAGIGSASHLCGLLLKSSLKKNIATIPYRGTSLAMIDLLAGQVDMICDLTVNAIPHVVSGKIQPIGLTVEGPLTGTPLATVPSLRQFGIDNVDLTVWFAMYAPRGTPPAVLQRLSAGLTKAVQNPQFQRQQIDSGIHVINDNRLSPKGHRQYLQQELKRWTPIIHAAGEYAD